MTLQRFFVSPGAIEGERVIFSQDQSRQMRAVLRLKPGDKVIALDGSGEELLVRLSDVGTSVAGAIQNRRRNQAEPAVSLVLYQGLLKGAKLELVLQKGTEIGVSRFVPVVAERAVRMEYSPSKQQRYESIVREAAEQSRRGRLPALAGSMKWRDAVLEAARAGPAVVLWEDEEALHLRDVPIERMSTLSLLVGPEGGLTLEEVEQARAAGAHIVTLGRRILRAETAAIVGAALLLARAGELG